MIVTAKNFFLRGWSKSVDCAGPKIHYKTPYLLFQVRDPFPSMAGHLMPLMLKVKRLYKFFKVLLLPSSAGERRKVKAGEELLAHLI